MDCTRGRANDETTSGQRRQRYDPTWRREYQLKKNYGLTIAAYEQMLDAQGGVCAICQGPSEREHFDVDHDHLTGNVRALLCGNCNRGLGGFRDDPELIDLAASYLRAHRGDA